jgi:general secretion pathway protein I
MINKKSGFTLIEVLVALVILAIALTAVIKATNDNIRMLDYLQQRTLSHWVALNVLAEMQTGLQKLPSDGNDISGQTILLNETWYWSARLTNDTGYSSRVDIAVSTAKETKAITHVIGFLRIQPT